MMMSEESASFLETKRYAVVTGANKGIGFEACKQLASLGVTVVLTARDHKKGLGALERLREDGLGDFVHFHQLDVADSESVAALADFVKSKFGKLDILVNNAAIIGVVIDPEVMRARAAAVPGIGVTIFDGIASQTYPLAQECIDINFYGVKKMVQAFLPLLQSSDSPRIINVSSGGGRLGYIKNEWAEGILDNIEDLTEAKLDEVIKESLQDLEDGSYEAKGWPARLPAYSLSKAVLNSYTRLLAKEYPGIAINCLSPGFVRTDMTNDYGNFSVEEGGAVPVWVALRPKGTTGLFFDRYEVISYQWHIQCL